MKEVTTKAKQNNLCNVRTYADFMFENLKHGYLSKKLQLLTMKSLRK